MRVFAGLASKEDKERILLETPEGKFWLKPNPLTESLGTLDAVSINGQIYYIYGEGLHTDDKGRHCYLHAEIYQNVKSLLERDKYGRQINGLRVVHNLNDLIIKE